MSAASSSPLSFTADHELNGVVAATLERAIRRHPDVVMVSGARGSGKSRVIEIADDAARKQSMRILTMRGTIVPTPSPYQAVQDMIRPLQTEFESLVPEHREDLRSLSAGRTGDLDAATIRIGILRLLQAASEHAPICLLVDDIDLVDRESFELTAYVLPRLDDARVATVVTATRAPRWNRAVSITLDPLPDDHVTAVLADRGLAAGPARACARAARGLPGMAIALADGLSRAQRSGHERLPPLIRPARSLLDHQQTVLGSLAPEIQRALVVVAADELGDIAAVRRALRILGEDDHALEQAETHGLIELDGLVVRFVDPWWRPAAYYLVAPASRRAAHRALAEAYSAPDHAIARAWQLAAAASGPSDHVAEALGLVGADQARRGHTPAAIEAYGRATEFAESASMREQLLVGALEIALDGLALGTARDLANRIEPTTVEAAIAVAEVFELTGAAAVELSHEQLATDGHWARRRRARIDRDRAARGGRFPETERAPISVRCLHDVHEYIAIAQANRHAGRLSQALETLVQLEEQLNESCTELYATVAVLRADLDLLAGNFDTCDKGLRPAARATSAWTSVAADWVRLRLNAATDPRSPAPWHAAAGIDIATEPLSAIRSSIARGLRRKDLALLLDTSRHAERLGLPIEAAEATLARLELAACSGASDVTELRSVAERLRSLGIHAWDERLGTLQQPPGRAVNADLSLLSQAERRVADAVGSGMTNREAATSLYLSVKTIDFHLQQIYRKLAVRSRTELAVVILGEDARVRRYVSL